MKTLRNLFLSTCLLALAGATTVGCASNSKKAMEPASPMSDDASGPMDDPTTDADDMADPCAAPMGKDAPDEDSLMGKDPCDPPVPE